MKQETGYLEAEDGKEIFYRFLVPEEPAAAVIVLHGIAEHSGRYEHVINYLGSRGYAAFAPDHRGHGRSPGVAGDIRSLEKVLSDIRLLHRTVLQSIPGAPVFMLGYSMGGLLALLYAQQYQEELRGMILSAATARVPEFVSPFLVRISGIVARLFPLLPMQDFDYTQICGDPEVIEKIEEDPLYYKGKIRARTGFELLEGMKKAEGGLAGLSLPVLVLHGGGDVTVEPEVSELIFQKIAGRDKTKKIFPGLKHEIMNEPQKQEILELIGDWIRKRIS